VILTPHEMPLLRNIDMLSPFFISFLPLASAARGCFLQLLKIAQKRGVIVCVCGTSIKIEWMLRSHHVAYDIDEEDSVKERFATHKPDAATERILLFLTIHEALQFCEKGLMTRIGSQNRTLSEEFLSRMLRYERQTLASVFGRILGSSSEEMKILQLFDGMRYHTEMDYEPGQEVFFKGSKSDGFYVVLHGAVAVSIKEDDPRHQVYRNNASIVSGAGPVKQQKSQSHLIESALRQDDDIVVASVWPVGGVFGYVDFLLHRPRVFTAVATQEGTVVAKLTLEQIHLLQNESPALDNCLQRVLFKASLKDLANCTCDE
jgi:CRP-like cAMP-binding protein